MKKTYSSSYVTPRFETLFILNQGNKYQSGKDPDAAATTAASVGASVFVT